jgi:hypothetical protein
MTSRWPRACAAECSRIRRSSAGAGATSSSASLTAVSRWGSSSEGPSGKKKKSLLPRRLERRVVADLDALNGQSERLPILRVRPRRAAMDGAGELIEDDDQREPRSWPLRPMLEIAARRPLQQQWKPRGDRSVRTAAKPPFELADHHGMIIAQMLGEPEPQNVFEFFARHALSHRAFPIA